MKAIVFEAFGPPENLKVCDFPTPKPGSGDILVKVKVAGVCHHDVLHRAGKLPGAKAGVVLGHETAGQVVAVGSDHAYPVVCQSDDPILNFRHGPSWLPDDTPRISAGLYR